MTSLSRPVVRTLQRKADAALQNEHLTRQRVENLEAFAQNVAALLQMGFWRRLRWIVTGR